MEQEVKTKEAEQREKIIRSPASGAISIRLRIISLNKKVLKEVVSLNNG